MEKTRRQPDVPEESSGLARQRFLTEREAAALTGQGMGTKAKPHHTPLIALRLPPALIARADELVPVLAATGELVGVSRSLVLRLALDEGLRVLERRARSQRT